MRPIEKNKVNDEIRNASNTEKSNPVESTVAKIKIDEPKDNFAKHSTGMCTSLKRKDLEGNYEVNQTCKVIHPQQMNY